MTTIYKCIKGFKDRGGDRARIGQEFVIRKKDYLGDTILDRKSGRGSLIVIPVEKFNTYFQEVKPVAKKELGTPKKEVTTLHKKELKEKNELQNEFKVGDKVMIAKSSEYYDISESNPAGIEGIVTVSKEADFMGFLYEVKWSNGRKNSYKEGDLVAYKEPKKELVDDRLPVGSYVEILVDSPNGANLKKGEIVEIVDHIREWSYRLGKDGWFVHKGYVKPASKKELPRTKKEFKVGDRVMITESSEFYNKSSHSTSSNPAGIKGTVTDTGRLKKVVGATLDLEVRWDNDESNMYDPGDLVLATGTKPAKFPIGAKVEVLVNQPNGADMKKGQIGVIEDIYRDVPDYTSYKISDGKGNTWAIRQQFLEVVEEIGNEYTPILEKKKGER